MREKSNCDTKSVILGRKHQFWVKLSGHCSYYETSSWITREERSTGTNHSSLDRTYLMREVSTKKVPPLDEISNRYSLIQFPFGCITHTENLS